MLNSEQKNFTYTQRFAIESIPQFMPVARTSLFFSLSYVLLTPYLMKYRNEPTVMAGLRKALIIPGVIVESWLGSTKGGTQVKYSWEDVAFLGLDGSLKPSLFFLQHKLYTATPSDYMLWASFGAGPLAAALFIHSRQKQLCKTEKISHEHLACNFQETSDFIYASFVEGGIHASVMYVGGSYFVSLLQKKITLPIIDKASNYALGAICSVFAAGTDLYDLHTKDYYAKAKLCVGTAVGAKALIGYGTIYISEVAFTAVEGVLISYPMSMLNRFGSEGLAELFHSAVYGPKINFWASAIFSYAVGTGGAASYLGSVAALLYESKDSIAEFPEKFLDAMPEIGGRMILASICAVITTQALPCFVLSNVLGAYFGIAIEDGVDWVKTLIIGKTHE